MRILHIITQKPFATGSGVYLSGIMAQFEKSHEQALICGLNAEHESGLPIETATLTVDPVIFERPGLNFPVPGMSDVMPYRSTRYGDLTDVQTEELIEAFLKKVRKAVKSFQPDVIICHHLYLLTARLTLELKAAAGVNGPVPVIGICHGSELRQFKNTAKWHEVIKAGVSRLDRIISTHVEQAEEIMDLYGVAPEKIRILGSGFNADIFKPDPLAVKPDKPVRIVFTGKLAGAKGVPELLQACDILSESNPIHLTLIGSGADPVEFQAIKQAAAAKTYPVELTGQLEQSEIARIFQRSHLFILPSYYEGMPLVVAEALACGMSVAVTDLPGFAGWLAPFRTKVRLIPRPDMATLDRPTEAGRRKFILDIAQAAQGLIDCPDSSTPADLSAMTWQGLSIKLEQVISEIRDVH